MNLELLRSTWLPWVVLGGLAAIIGAALALASSPNSLAKASPRGGSGGRTATSLTGPFLTPKASPTPQIKPGQLKAPVTIQVLGTLLYVTAADRSITSADGETWAALPSSPNGGVVIPDPANPLRFIGGGSGLQISTNSGKSWRPPATIPPAPGPYQPLAISPTEPAVWFALHQGRLARTRDDGASWRDLAGFPSIAPNPTISAGSNRGQFFLTSDTRVYELVDNGQQVLSRGQIPGAAPIASLVQATAGSPGVLIARSSEGALFALREDNWSEIHPPFSGPLSGAPGRLAVITDGGTEVGTAGKVIVSSDGGTSWTPATGLPSNQSVTAAGINSDGQTGYAYCAGGDLYKSADGGRTWSLASSSLRSA